MSIMVQPFTDEWREQWLSVAASLRTTGRTSHSEDADLIERILEGQAEAAQRDAAERARVIRERTGTVNEVAEETGYDAAYLRQLLREDKLVNRNPDLRPAWLRYADVWALKNVPVEVAAAACLAGAPADQGRTSAPVSPERIIVRVVG